MKQVFLLLFPFLLLAQTYTFSYANENVAMAIASKILIKAYERANISIQVISFSSERSLNASNSGQVDGEVARIADISKLYPNLVQVPVSLVDVEAVAFSKTPNLYISKWDDLKKYDFTIIKGTKFIEKSTQAYDKDYVSTFIQAFDALKDDKTDLIVVPKKAAIRLCLRAQYKDIKRISPVLKKLKLYHFVHAKNTHLIAKILPILEQMKKSGEINYIEKSYLRSLTKYNN